MREISPAYGMSADEYLKLQPSESRSLVAHIRKQKREGSRPMPSRSILDRSTLLSMVTRNYLLDRVALLVDENLFGRSDMCIQFATLLHLALIELGIDSRIAVGKAMYFDGSKELFRWDHTWVRIGSEVVDGNTDILHENPMVPMTVRVSPYWGPIANIPNDRRLRVANDSNAPHDDDVRNIWWPELKDEIQKFKPLI